jgi:hypothetical protein
LPDPDDPITAVVFPHSMLNDRFFSIYFPGFEGYENVMSLNSIAPLMLTFFPFPISEIL